ncbi:MAG: M23 family metallopeptidase [Candidatus Krumholzibacteriia bacterium]
MSRLVSMRLACVLGLLADCSADGAAAASNDPVWPLAVQAVLTSSFGEPRPTHLHAGIDLGTGGRTGVRCYAVGDGYLARMRMSPFGYGKALYIQLDSGPLVVYAHLDRFAEPMASRAWREQRRRKRYTFDVYLPADEIRVRRGEVIAWSGDTGIGFPHLHFEMRDGDVARNPQTAGFAVPDVVPPVIRDVAVMPLDPDSHVEGGPETHVIRVGGAQSLAQPVRVAGRLGFAVRALDRAASGPHRQVPYRYEVRVNGRTMYRAVHERFDYAHNHHIVLDYDQERLVRSHARAFQLFARAGNRLEGREPADASRGVLHAVVQGSVAGDAVSVVGPGRHDVEIEVADVAGHTRSVRLPLLVTSAPRIDVLEARRRRGGALRVECVASDADGDSLQVDLAVSVDAGRTWEPLPGHLVDGAWTAEIEPGAPATLALRARVVDPSGLEAVRTWAHAASDSTTSALPLEVGARWRNGKLVVTVESRVLLESPPEAALVLADGGRYALGRRRQIDTRRYRWVAAVGEIGGDPEALEISATAIDGRRAILERQMRARIVRRGAARSVADLHPRLRLEFAAGSLFEDVAVRVRGFDPHELELGPELRPAGPCVEVGSRAAALEGSVRVILAAGDAAVAGTSAEDPAGLFWVDRRGNLRFLSAERDADGALVGEARFLSIFAVLADDTPPALRDFRQVRRGGRPVWLEFVVEDFGAELADGAIDVDVDGTLAIPEWDPETGRVLVHPVESLEAGPHRLNVRVADRVGNRARQSWAFEIP